MKGKACIVARADKLLSDRNLFNMNLDPKSSPSDSVLLYSLILPSQPFIQTHNRKFSLPVTLSNTINADGDSLIASCILNAALRKVSGYPATPPRYRIPLENF